MLEIKCHGEEQYFGIPKKCHGILTSSLFLGTTGFWTGEDGLNFFPFSPFPPIFVVVVNFFMDGALKNPL